MVQAETFQDDAMAPRYRSSAAARMVNIPVATLRVWERRYRVVGPAQAASGQRLYSSQDIRRLVLIKQMVNRGHGIGMLARMGTPSLQDLADEADHTEALLSGHKSASAAHEPRQALGARDDIRVLLVGQDAAARWSGRLMETGGVNVVGAIDGSAVSELSLKHMQADLIVADLGPMHMETVDWLGRLARTVGARQTMVVYGFANSQVVGALQARGVILHRAPVQFAAIKRSMMDAVRAWRSVAQGLRTVPDPARPPRLDAAGMGTLVQSMPRVACECPRHLADLVNMLGQFEAYSAECETREPADVALHAYLYRVAGHARALMEDALITLAEAEGVALPLRGAAAVAGDQATA